MGVIEHRNGRLFIYSIGPNLQDEHGDYDPKEYKTGRFDDVGAVGRDVKLRRQQAWADEEDTP